MMKKTLNKKLNIIQLKFISNLCYTKKWRKKSGKIIFK